MNKDTVASYIDLLEQSFVIFRLKGFSRNLRKEVSKQDKVYFWDLGVRNTVIDNLNLLNDRNDVGQLWENLMVVERRKWHSYRGLLGSFYFWRTHAGAEIDLIEERDGKLFAFEYKWTKRSVRQPQLFLDTYPGAEFSLITQDNWLEHVGARLAERDSQPAGRNGHGQD